MSKNQVTIPAELIPEFEAWGRATVSLFGKLRRKSNPQPKDHHNQDWFWSDDWQVKEAEADKDVSSGRVTEFDDVTDAIKYLRSQK